MKKITIIQIISITFLCFITIGCGSNDQAEQQREQLDTEPISFSGDRQQSDRNDGQGEQQQLQRGKLPIQPGREQNIFTNEQEQNQQENQGIRTTPPTGEETNDAETNSMDQSFQEEVMKLTNQERKKQGLASLQLDKELAEVAQTKSEDMAKNNYFSHTSPTYGSPFDMLQQFGIDYTTAAENIASGQQSPSEVVTGWMNSPGHRKNILNEKVTHIGVGYAENGSYWTQLFIAK